jgi:hypothetical protein
MPTPAITTLRTTIATALTNNAKWQTFAFPPANILANSVIVSWDSPMLEMQNNQYNSIAPMANFRILMTVPLFDNQGNLSFLEEMVTDVFNLLAASSLNVAVSEISAPAQLSLPSGDLLTAEMSISILTSWS